MSFKKRFLHHCPWIFLLSHVAAIFKPSSLLLLFKYKRFISCKLSDLYFSSDFFSIRKGFQCWKKISPFFFFYSVSCGELISNSHNQWGKNLNQIPIYIQIYLVHLYYSSVMLKMRFRTNKGSEFHLSDPWCWNQHFPD